MGVRRFFPWSSGTESGLHDISVDKVTVSQTAFEDAPVTVQAAVSARGFGGSEIRAQLTEMAAGAARSRNERCRAASNGFFRRVKHRGRA